jgi:enamine deaminase RidA (YjgF/YER057c/UK114 family)
MESVGGSLSDVVTTKSYWTDYGSWSAIGTARAGIFGEKPPTGTRVAIEGLARPEFLLEVEAVAYLNAWTGGNEMATVEHIQPKGSPPNDNRYTHVVKVGPWVHIAGQTATDENGEIVGIGDPAAQVEQVFKNLTTAVESVGGKLTDIVKTTVYVVGRENVEAIRQARAGRFGDKPPTSTLLVISGLARPEFVLEIEAVAYVE